MSADGLARARTWRIARLPWLTIAVLGVTSGVTAAAYSWPSIGGALQRSPAVRDGEVWRLVTSWLVNTDGALQVTVNSIGLAAYGVAAEYTAGRRWWFWAYAAAGLAGELAGLAWQPTGGGNSVAICGLIGLFSCWQAVKWAGPRAAAMAGAAGWAAIGLWLLVHTDVHGAALAGGFGVGVLFVLAG